MIIRFTSAKHAQSETLRDDDLIAQRDGIIAGFVLTALYIGLCIYASYRAKKNVTPEDPIHLVPHATEFHDRPRQNWKRSDTVFYHGPESRQTDRTSAPQENEREKELTGSHRK